MKEVPSSCEHKALTKADRLAREKSNNSRQLSVSEMMLLLGLTAGTAYFALQPLAPTLPSHALASEAVSDREADEVSPRW